MTEERDELVDQVIDKVRPAPRLTARTLMQKLLDHIGTYPEDLDVPLTVWVEGDEGGGPYGDVGWCEFEPVVICPGSVDGADGTPETKAEDGHPTFTLEVGRGFDTRSL